MPIYPTIHVQRRDAALAIDAMRYLIEAAEVVEYSGDHDRDSVRRIQAALYRITARLEEAS